MEQIKQKRRSVFRINAKDAGYWLLLVFLTLPHMKPAYLARFPAVDMVFDVLRGASFLIIVFWYVVKRRPISIVIILAAIWRVFLVYSTYVHRGEVYNSLVTSFSILSVMLLYDTAYNSEKITFISAQMFCFEILIYVNLITELLYPSGMYVGVSFPKAPNWFLGYYNGYTQYYIPALMFAWLYREKTKRWFRTVLLTAAIIASACVVYAGGQTVALVCMFIVYVFFKNQTTLFHYYNYWMIHIVYFVAIYVMKIQNLFIWLLDDVLGKLSSFVGRIGLWEKTIVLVKASPIIGYGLKSGTERMAEYHIGFALHAHNMLLELLYEGGLLGLFLWILIVVFAGKRIYKYRDTRESKIISIAFLGWCMVTLVEPFTTPFFMGMFVIASRSNRSELAGNTGEQLPEGI